MREDTHVAAVGYNPPQMPRAPAEGGCKVGDCIPAHRYRPNRTLFALVNVDLPIPRRDEVSSVVFCLIPQIFSSFSQNPVFQVFEKFSSH